ncbi:MAG: toprim domain-containing protein [Candidatus Bathyarchaeota archaeon]|nr:toprim domain-containing protein [Candidatus Bathyarchaeota archaeon]
MSCKLKEKQEKLQQILAALIEESAKGTPIIVEGQKDLQTLRNLGAYGSIITVKTGGKSFIDAISEIQKTHVSEAILLLDFDRRGKEGTARLKQNLEFAKIKPNLWYWQTLSALIGREIHCIESLNGYLDTLKRKTTLWQAKKVTNLFSSFEQSAIEFYQ